MNDKKAKRLRKIIGFNPNEPREYTKTSQRVSTGKRSLYQAAKKKIIWEYQEVKHVKGK